jgi:hypothetical protein
MDRNPQSRAKGAIRARVGRCAAPRSFTLGRLQPLPRRVGEQLTLTVEHRAAASAPHTRLCGDAGLRLRDRAAHDPMRHARPRQARRADARRRARALDSRAAARVASTSTSCAILSDLVTDGRVRPPRPAGQPGGAFRLASRPHSVRETETKCRSVNDAINERTMPSSGQVVGGRQRSHRSGRANNPGDASVSTVGSGTSLT